MSLGHKTIDGKDYKIVYREGDILKLEKNHLNKLSPLMKRTLRSGMRKMWQATTRSEFIKEVRVPYEGVGRFSFGVKCVVCGLMMGQSERSHIKLRSGLQSKKPKLVYQVDHIDKNHTLETRQDIPLYADSLFNGDLRILCWGCHDGVTYAKV